MHHCEYSFELIANDRRAAHSGAQAEPSRNHAVAVPENVGARAAGFENCNDFGKRILIGNDRHINPVQRRRKFWRVCGTSENRNYRKLRIRSGLLESAMEFLSLQIGKAMPGHEKYQGIGFMELTAR